MNGAIIMLLFLDLMAIGSVVFFHFYDKRPAQSDM